MSWFPKRRGRCDSHGVDLADGLHLSPKTLGASLPSAPPAEYVWSPDATYFGLVSPWFGNSHHRWMG